MKILLTLLMSLVLTLPALAKEKSYGIFPGVTYIKNYDGDTITVDIPYVPTIIGDSINIRVNGIDTPEIKGKCQKEKVLALSAKGYVENILTATKRIDLLNIKRGKYFRIVADIQTTQGDLANLLIKEGYAVEYDGKTKFKDWCK